MKVEAGKVTDTVHLIDWKQPNKNDFAVAEEVTLHGPLKWRPDLIIYLNGIAVGVIELKNSYSSIENGIRQSLSNQEKEFNQWFFNTVQIIFAGNDSEGLRYGSIKTEEKYFLKWKEDEQDNTRFKIDKYLLKMCRKDLTHRTNARLRSLRWWCEKAATGSSVHRRKKGAGIRQCLQGRHHLAHAGQRQEYRDGPARSLDSQTNPTRACSSLPIATSSTNRSSASFTTLAKPSTARAAGAI